MMNKSINRKLKGVLIKTLLILIVTLCIVFSTFYLSATSTQEVVTVNGTKISYRDGGYVYINSEHSSSGGEFRGVWVSPLTGDITTYTDKLSYQNQMLQVIHYMEIYNLNVMIFHVRIMNDALYESKYNNWSSYYSTSPDWDMLPWLIEECHKHGIEFHAWMNPYRVTTNVSLSLEECAARYKSTNAASNPKNLLKASSTIILDPGIPEVQDFLVDTCMELVENYNVDAIHFDDYFYAAGIDDSETIKKYNVNNLSEANFRRSAVDAFIEKLSTSLRAFNLETGRRVQLGIAPTGVWSNGNGVVSYDANGRASSTGSRTSAYAHYGSPLYADTLKWINNNWIDYILPQTYWAITNSAGPYCDLVKWWDAVCKYSKTNFYSSLGLYMSAGGNASWSTNHYEAYQQIMLANTLEHTHGSSIYNYNSYVGAVNNPDKAFRDVDKIWSKAVYLPEIRTMDAIVPSKVSNLSISKNDYGYTLRFDKLDEAKFYCIYRSENAITFDEEEIIDVIGNVGHNGKIEYTDYNTTAGKTYYYGIKAQSNSLTLGEGERISTSQAQSGGTLYLGDITGVSLNADLVEGKTAYIKFDKLRYPLGSEVKYDVNVSFYQGDTKSSTISAPVQVRNNINIISFAMPKNTSSIEVSIKAYNNCGESYCVRSYDVYQDLGNVTNFDIEYDYPYNGSDATFIWNKLDNNVSYEIEYSLDNFEYNLLEEVTNIKTSGINVLYSTKLSEPNNINGKKVYYRIKAKTVDGICYSDVFVINQFNYLGNIENFRVNGERRISKVDVEEGDELTLEWNNSNNKATYSVFISFDGKNWMGISAYNHSAETLLNGSIYVSTIPITYTYFCFYLKVEALASGSKAESSVVEVNVKMNDVYSDEVVVYLYNYYSMFIDNMNIYK